MSYCINPWCSNRQNDDHAQICLACGTTLLLDSRFCVLRSVGELRKFHPFDVFEAIDYVGTPIRSANTIVILKVLKDDEEKYLKLFRQEFEALKTLRHSGIPESDPDDFFSVGIGGNEEDLLHCLTMSKFEGISLTQWVKENGRLSQDRVIDWLGQIGEILDYMHNRGYFHRDIKPDNIIVQPNCKLALIDFGGAREITDTYLSKITYPATQALTQIHSLLYSAPEQINGRAVPQSDFYSLGRTFIFAATGKEINELPMDEKTGQLRWFHETSQLDQPLIRFIQSLVNPLPRKRPINSGELLSILFDDLPRSLKWMRRRRSKMFKFFSIVILGIMGLAFFQVGRIALSAQFLSIARDQLQSNQLKQSKENLEKSIKIRPTEEAYLSLGDVCDRINSNKHSSESSQCAIDSYKKVTQINKKNSTAFFNLAILYEDRMYKNKNKKELLLDKNSYLLAVDAYKQAVNISKNNPIYINNLARIYILKKDYVSAKDLINPLIDPKTSRITDPYSLALLHKNLGWTKFQEKNLDEASRLLNKSINYKQPFISAYCLLAQTKEAQGRSSAKEWEYCFEPDAEDVSNPEVRRWHKIYIDRKHSRK